MITFHLVAAHYYLLLLPLLLLGTTITIISIMIILHYFISLLLLILLLCWSSLSSLSSSFVMIVSGSIFITIIISTHIIVHTRVYQLRCYRCHQYIDTSLLTENGRRPWRRPWRFSIGKPTGSHPHYIEVRRNWRTDVERTCLCLRLSSCNTGTFFNTRRVVRWIHVGDSLCDHMYNCEL